MQFPFTICCQESWQQYLPVPLTARQEIAISPLKKHSNQKEKPIKTDKRTPPNNCEGSTKNVKNTLGIEETLKTKINVIKQRQ